MTAIAHSVMLDPDFWRASRQAMLRTARREAILREEHLKQVMLYPLRETLMATGYSRPAIAPSIDALAVTRDIARGG